MQTGERYFFGPFELSLERKTLFRHGVPLPMKPKSFDLLLLLLENRQRVVPKEELIALLWPGQFIEDSSLTQVVYELRKALGNDGTTYVETIPKRGYRFAAEIDRVIPATSPSLPPARRSIAILPFAPLPGAEHDAALEQGIAETLMTALSRMPGLLVRPSGSVRRYAERAGDPVTAGREMGVDAVLEGTIQRSGDRLRVTAHLIGVADHTVLWAGTFDEAFTDIFTVQDSICTRVVSALQLEISPEATRRLMPRHTTDVETHQLFLQCRYYWQKWTPENWFRSIRCGMQALERDPLHAPSYSWTAASWTTLGVTGVVAPREAFQNARELVAKALELDDELPEAHEVLGAIALFHDWDREAADSALLRACALNPGYAGARNLRALLLCFTGRFEEALGEIGLAIENDPLSLLVNTDMAAVLYFARRYEEAIAQFQRTLELDPWFAHARSSLGYALLQRGRMADAIDEFGRAAEYSGRARDASHDLAFAHAISGDHDFARRVLGTLANESAERYVDPYSIAIIHLGLGEWNETFAALEHALHERSRDLIYLGVNPIMDPIRDDPRFAGVIERVGL